MMINFYRGDDYTERIRFKNFTGPIEDMFFTVKDTNKSPVIKKRLNKGIELSEEGWYHIDFLPEDTDDLKPKVTMNFDIEIITNGKKHTVEKGTFILDEDITTPDCEV